MHLLLSSIDKTTQKTQGKAKICCAWPVEEFVIRSVSASALASGRAANQSTLFRPRLYGRRLTEAAENPHGHACGTANPSLTLRVVKEAKCLNMQSFQFVVLTVVGYLNTFAIGRTAFHAEFLRCFCASWSHYYSSYATASRRRSGRTGIITHATALIMLLLGMLYLGMLRVVLTTRTAASTMRTQRIRLLATPRACGFWHSETSPASVNDHWPRRIPLWTMRDLPVLCDRSTRYVG